MSCAKFGLSYAGNNRDDIFNLQQWQHLLGITENSHRVSARPKPIVDPSCITPTDMHSIKQESIVRGNSYRGSRSHIARPGISVAKSNSLRQGLIANLITYIYVSIFESRP